MQDAILTFSPFLSHFLPSFAVISSKITKHSPVIFYSLQSTFIVISFEHLRSFIGKYKLSPISTDQET